MQNKKLIQMYVNNFRRALSPHLKSGVGVKSRIFPAEGEGAILEFEIGPELQNIDEYKDIASTVGIALKGIKQNAFGGQLENINFKGTNVIVENNRIILVKGEDQNELWSDQAVEKDLIRILPKKEGE